MKFGSNLDQTLARIKVKVVSMSIILTKILSIRLLIHSVSSVLHYGELGD
jgi:hypothetical protein